MGACLRNGQQEGDGGEGEQQGGDGGGGGGGGGGGEVGRQAHCVASSPAHPTLKTDRETFEASPLLASSLRIHQSQKRLTMFGTAISP